MHIRKSKSSDLNKIKLIYKRARKFMISMNNPTQWGNLYPMDNIIENDIGTSYVVVDNGNVVGVFVFEENADEKAYLTIQGNWQNDEPYAVIHRCASSAEVKNVATTMFNWCFEKFPNIRIDTHKNNLPMIKCLEKNGFKYCGEVFYDFEKRRPDGLKDNVRIAYQKIR